MSMSNPIKYLLLVVTTALIGCHEANAPGYKQLHEAVFQNNCTQSACHTGMPGIAGVSFDDARSSYDTLLKRAPVNSGAAEAGYHLVVPGDPERSFLLTKMTLPQHELAERGFGGPMPLAAVEIPGPQTLQAVRDWIAAGAPYDGLAVAVDTMAAPADDIYVTCAATDEAGLRECFGQTPDPEKTLRLFTPPLTVQPGAEILYCSYLDYIAPRDLLFKRVRGVQMRGGHHAGVFVSIAPTDMTAPQECGDEMSHLRYTAGAGGAGAQATELPPGVSLRILKGQQIVIQSHYINSTTEPIVVMDMVELDFTSPEESPIIVDPFAMLYDGIAIPPGERGYQRTTECELDQDMDIYMLLGHTHESGVLFEFHHLPGGDGEPVRLYRATDGKLLRESPEIKTYDPPVQFAAGDKLRVTCTWDNHTDHEIGWPEEMCVALMYYGPGRGWLTCDENDGTPQLRGDDPQEGCVAVDNPGNDIGVGRACTAGGDECLDSDTASLCLAIFDARANFCTFFGCSADTDCGRGAVCSDQGAAKVCIPTECL